MSQAEIQITDTPPLPGVQLVQELNDAFEALATDFSGSVDPAAYAFAYSLWADTGTGDLKRRNAANNAWVVVGRIFPDAAPAFSAFHGGTAQVINAAAWTKVRIETEEFDTATCFDSTTNYRFTPTVAGYYQASGAVQFAGGATNAASIYKNGVIYKAGSVILTPSGQGSSVSTLVFMNGSTDYIEFYAYSNVTATLLNNSGSTWFNGCLMRAA